MIHERLYRKDNVKRDDRLYKDLTRFSRHIDRALLVDSRADTCLQVENQLKISAFYGDSADIELKRLATFFKDRVSDLQHNVDLRTLPDEYALIN